MKGFQLQYFVYRDVVIFIFALLAADGEQKKEKESISPEVVLFACNEDLAQAQRRLPRECRYFRRYFEALEYLLYVPPYYSGV